MSDLSVRARRVALGLILLGAALLRLRLLDIPLERDEGEFALAGQLLLAGIPPFQDVYSMKMPGIYVAYAIVMAIFGESTVGIHTGLLFVNLVSICLVHLLAMRLFGPLIGLAAAAFYALLSVQPSVLGVFAHATHFVMLFALAGILLLLRSRERTGYRAVLGGALLLGIAFVAKQHGIAFIAFGGLMVLSDASRSISNPLTRRDAVHSITAYGVGAALPFLVCCGWLHAAGVFETFRFWTFDYALAYTSITGPDEAWHALKEALSDHWRTIEIVWLLAAGGMGLVLFGDIDRRSRSFMIQFAAFSALAVTPGFYFRQHYFVMLLPVVAMLASLGAHRLAQAVLPNGRPGAHAMIILTAFAIASSGNIARNAGYFFNEPVDVISHRLYPPHFFPEAVPIAEYVATLTSPDDRIAVLGSEPQIYFHARRRPATGFMYMYPLMEIQPFARSMQEEMAEEIEQARPKVLVYYNGTGGWAPARGSDLFIRQWMTSYAKTYELVGVADLSVARGSQYTWGPEAIAHKPRSQNWVGVYLRSGGDTE